MIGHARPGFPYHSGMPATPRVADAAARLRNELSRRIVGMEEVVEQVLWCVASGSHGLLVGVPGLAKTLLVSSLAELLDLKFRRIQFTPDLMPTDIVGTEILGADDSGGRSFRFQPGPVFANLLLADEINRTPPKTQAALMEAMEEGQVTSAGRRHALEPPFLVLATQNPIEQEGTYPLPAAQLDRFLVRIRVGYPGKDDERALVRRTTSRPRTPLPSVLSREEVLGLAAAVRRAPAPDPVVRYAVAVARGTRPRDPGAAPGIENAVAFGVGPRAAGALLLAAKARAALAGREAPSPEDVRAVAHPVLRHRLVLSFRASAEGIGPDAVVEQVLAAVPAPDGWKSSLEPSGAAWSARFGA
jgi:MoxR-like ATPase